MTAPLRGADVTVVIATTGNRIALLEQALNSVRDQTTPLGAAHTGLEPNHVGGAR
jgi:hypothetical protein